MKPKSLKPNASGLAASPVAASWLADILRRRHRHYLEELKHCRQSPSVKAVHDLRVAVRRLISVIELLAHYHRSRSSRKAVAVLKQQLRSLGGLRDAQVRRAELAQRRKAFPELAMVLKHLRKEKDKITRDASPKIKRFKKRKVAACVRELMTELKRVRREVRRQRTLEAALVGAAAGAFEKTVERHRLIDYSDLETIHRTRIAFKKFRYLVECLPPEMTGLGKRKLQALDRHQGRMGAIQDLAVLQAGIERFVKRKPKSGSALKPFAAHLRHRRAAAIRSFRQAAGLLFKFRPVF